MDVGDDGVCEKKKISHLDNRKKSKKKKVGKRDGKKPKKRPLFSLRLCTRFRQQAGVSKKNRCGHENRAYGIDPQARPKPVMNGVDKRGEKRKVDESEANPKSDDLGPKKKNWKKRSRPPPPHEKLGNEIYIRHEKGTKNHSRRKKRG